MDAEIIVIPVVFLIPSAVIVFRMWIKHREHMASLQRGRGQSPEIEQRLARVEDAVNAIAVEMERVGEGQRFLTKILAERERAALPDESAGGRGRAITPH